MELRDSAERRLVQRALQAASLQGMRKHEQNHRLRLFEVKIKYIKSN